MSAETTYCKACFISDILFILIFCHWTNTSWYSYWKYYWRGKTIGNLYFSGFNFLFSSICQEKESLCCLHKHLVLGGCANKLRLRDLQCETWFYVSLLASFGPPCLLFTQAFVYIFQWTVCNVWLGISE